MTKTHKILWVGDAVVSSGFSKCTHIVCDELHARGWDVHVLGLNYFGDPHNYPYKIYPCFHPLEGGRDYFGVTRLPHMVEELQPDVVVFLNDPWNIPGYLKSLEDLKANEDFKFPITVGWLAVDSMNQHGEPINALDRVVVWTAFAEQELRKGGFIGQCNVVPLGVDSKIFQPQLKAESREKVCPKGLPEDAFIVGVVGRNQPRKRIDLSIKCFANWIAGYSVENAYLYLHVAPTGDRGCDIRSVVKWYGVAHKVILAQPGVGLGMDESIMPYVYSAFDVYLSTSQGEGWGLPALEAMACSVPCILPDSAAFSEWAANIDKVELVPCSPSVLNAPLNSAAYTVGGLVYELGVIEALNRSYKYSVVTGGSGTRLTAFKYPWSTTARNMADILDREMADQEE